MQLPLRNQLNESTVDGRPDENRSANCVPASLSSGVSYLIGRDVFGDELKDAVYGETYTGATDPARYADYLKQKFGITLKEENADSGTQLVEFIKAGLAQGYPVTGAIPSQWGITTAADVAAHGGGTHEIIFQDASNGNLTAMNPWPSVGGNAFYQTMSEAWWASRLVYSRVFILQGTAMSFPKGVPVGWHDDGTTLTAPNGHKCTQGVRQVVLHGGTDPNSPSGWNPYEMPDDDGTYMDPADPTNPAGGFGFRQYFESCLICWLKAANQMVIVPGGKAALALSHVPAPDDTKRKALEAVVSQSISQLQAGLQAAQ